MAARPVTAGGESVAIPHAFDRLDLSERRLVFGPAPWWKS